MLLGYVPEATVPHSGSFPHTVYLAYLALQDECSRLQGTEMSTTGHTHTHKKTPKLELYENLGGFVCDAVLNANTRDKVSLHVPVSEDRYAQFKTKGWNLLKCVSAE